MSSPTLPSHLPCPINSLPLSLSSFNLCLHNVAAYRPSASSEFLPPCSPVILSSLGTFCVFVFHPYRTRSFFLVEFALFFFWHVVVSHLTANVMLMQTVEPRIERKSFLLSPSRLHVWTCHYTINTPLRGLVWSRQHEYLFSPWNNTVSMLCPLKQDGFPSSAAQEAGRDFFFFLFYWLCFSNDILFSLCPACPLLFSLLRYYTFILVMHLPVEGFENIFSWQTVENSIFRKWDISPPFF